LSCPSRVITPFRIGQLRDRPGRIGVRHAVGSPRDRVREYLVDHGGPTFVVTAHAKAGIEVIPMTCLVRRERASILQQVEIGDRRDDEIGAHCSRAPLGRNLLVQLGGLQPHEIDLDFRVALVEFGDPELSSIEPGCAINDEASFAPRLALESRFALHGRQLSQRLPDACVIARGRLGKRRFTESKE
jgi:hypothetical protein